ncbi:hypothetical protein FEMY_24730 [Ferrovum myxofaciens]|uniref:Uncharacterized protein n=2 Tax=Ferrovum myxofaciens TaxID=416213 RepID=A0A149VUW8_9PROT|nr:hypothetical protein FEMY_24730 [Ferrovum myxofaciens]
MKRAVGCGYKVNFIFVCVESLALCQVRILERVDSGGHAVPAEDVSRRYSRSLRNLASAFDLAERVFILDNTEEKRRLLLSVEHGRERETSPSALRKSRRAQKKIPYLPHKRPNLQNK